MADTQTYPADIVITLIMTKQGELSDRAFAKELDISRRLWRETKNGDRPVGMALLEAIACAYSDMDEEILKHLRRRGRVSATDILTEPSPPEDKEQP